MAHGPTDFRICVSMTFEGLHAANDAWAKATRANVANV
jgi:hypothetical protein